MAKKAEEKVTYITEAEIDNIAKTTGEILAAQPKVAVMIAPDKDEPYFNCCINGFDYSFPRGEMVEVPESVAAFIKDRAQDVKSAQAYIEELKKGLTVR